MDKLSILIHAKLNVAQAQQTTNAQLKQLQAKLDPLQLKIDSASVSQQFKILENGTQKLTQSIHSASDAYGNQYKIIQQIDKKTKELDITQVKLVRNNKQMIADKTTELKLTQQLQNSYNKQMFSNFNSSIGIGNVAKSAKESASAFSELFAKADKTTVGLNSVEKQTAKLNPAMNDLAKTTEKSAQSFGSVIAKVALWTAVTTLVFAPIELAKGSISTIYEIDKAITNLKKVSDELGESVGIKEFTQDMNDLAIAIGHSTTSAIESAADFKRLGYTLDESRKLAEQALIYSNISDQNIGDATQSIISTLKGFQLGVEDVNHVMDAYNEVGNNFAITSAGIGRALQRSGSALYEANNTLEESIGLIVAGNASIQNVEKVGNGLFGSLVA